MKKIFRKNQVIITTLAFLIAIAGYISYDKASSAKEKDSMATNAQLGGENDSNVNGTYDIALGDGTESTAAAADKSKGGESVETGSTEVKVAELESTEEIKNPGEAVLTSTIAGHVDYAAQVKLNREQVRSKNKETLNAIIENKSLTDKQRQDAVNELVNITDIAEKEADAEMMLEAKGFTNVVVSIDEENCDVILDMGDVTDARCAQVEDIVKRKTGISADKIIITPINAGEETTVAQ